jgi:hypothetical protein
LFEKRLSTKAETAGGSAVEYRKRPVKGHLYNCLFGGFALLH